MKKLDESYTGVEKDLVTLECEVSKENTRCVWKKYGKVIEADDDKIIIESIGKIQRLTIKNLTLQDKQNISCVAVKGRNDDDELASTSTKVLVKEGPLGIVKGLEDTTAKEGQDGLLSVELNKPNEEVEWFKNGTKIRADLNHRIYAHNNTYFLRINDTSPTSDNGVYTFRVKSLETSARLDIEEKAVEILSQLKDKNCVENQQVRLEIELNKPDIQDRLVWYKNDEEIKLDSNIEVKAIGQKYSLVIKKAHFEDEAKYTVKVRDTELSSSANLSVEEAPLEFVRPLVDVELKENQTATFECELNKPGETVRWYKNGELIEPDNKDIIVRSDDGRVHQLVLKKLILQTRRNTRLKRVDHHQVLCYMLKKFLLNFFKS